MSHWPVWIAAALAAMCGAAVNAGEAPPSLLSADEAQAAARHELSVRLPLLPPAYARALRNAVVGHPLRVDRLDALNQTYYLVPFCQGSLTSLVVMIDARTGRFLEVSYLQTPSAYPPISEDKARALVLASVHAKAEKDAVVHAAPSLVWRACEQSQSAFEPLWRFTLPSGDRYVDQRGGVRHTLTEPRLKGGGPPGG